MFRWAKLDSQVGRRVLSLRLAQASPAGSGLVGFSLPLTLSLCSDWSCLCCSSLRAVAERGLGAIALLWGSTALLLLAASLLLLGFVPVCALA